MTCPHCDEWVEVWTSVGARVGFCPVCGEKVEVAGWILDGEEKEDE